MEERELSPLQKAVNEAQGVITEQSLAEAANTSRMAARFFMMKETHRGGHLEISKSAARENRFECYRVRSF